MTFGHNAVLGGRANSRKLRRGRAAKTCSRVYRRCSSADWTIQSLCGGLRSAMHDADAEEEFKYVRCRNLFGYGHSTVTGCRAIAALASLARCAGRARTQVSQPSRAPLSFELRTRCARDRESADDPVTGQRRRTPPLVPCSRMDSQGYSPRPTRPASTRREVVRPCRSVVRSCRSSEAPGSESF